MQISRLAKSAARGVARSPESQKGPGGDAPRDNLSSGRIDRVEISPEARARAKGEVPPHTEPSPATYRNVSERQVDVAARDAFARGQSTRRRVKRSRQAGFAKRDISADPKTTELNSERKSAFAKDRHDGFEARASKALRKNAQARDAMRAETAKESREKVAATRKENESQTSRTEFEEPTRRERDVVEEDTRARTQEEAVPTRQSLNSNNDQREAERVQTERQETPANDEKSSR